MQCYNTIRDVRDISSGSGVDEPVSLKEMKSYLRLLGFIDDDDETDIPEFDDDDDLIEQLIVSARQRFEQYLKCSIVSHSWQALGVTNIAGYQKLPYGPVSEITSITDCDDNAVDEDNIKLIGDDLKYPRYSDMTVEYSAGYDIVPTGIKEGIMKEVAFRYEHRGDEIEIGICEAAIILINPYQRASWLE